MPANSTSSARLTALILATYFLCTVLCTVEVLAAPGDWPQPRQNNWLTAIQPLPGGMKIPPVVLGKIAVSPGLPPVTEVSAPNSKGRWALCIAGGALHCFDENGKHQWISHPPGINYTDIVTAEDLNGDSTVEIALKAGRPAHPYSSAVLVSLLDGRLIWKYDVEPMSYAWYLHVDKFLPDKTTKQLIVLMQGYPPEKDNGYIAFFDFDDAAEAGQKNSPQQVWRYDFHQYTCYPSLLRTDLDGDGCKELAILTHSRMWFLDVLTGQVKQFIGWDVSPGNTRSYGLGRFIDLNADGVEDFLCIADFAQHHEVLLNRDGQFEKAWSHGWAESVMTGKVITTWPEPPNVDVDGDGKMEIVISMFNSEGENNWLVRIYDAVTGELKYRIPGAIAINTTDADHDGTAEIAVHLCEDPNRNQITGAQLISFKNSASDNQFIILWEDTDAAFILDKSGSLQHYAALSQNGQKQRLHLDNGRVVLEPEPAKTDADTKKPIPVPHIQAAAYPMILAADFTNNGCNEILIYNEPRVSIVRFENSGECKSTYEYVSDAPPALADLNGDGLLDIVTGRVSENSTPVIEARTPSQDNRLLWRSVFPPPDRTGLPWKSRKLYIRTGCFTGKQTPDLYVWAGVPLVRSTVLDGISGEIIWEHGEIGGGRYWGPTHNLTAVWDSNGDGCQDLVFTNPDYYCISDGHTGMFHVKPKHPPVIFNQPSLGLYTMPVLLPRDGQEPLVCLCGGHYFQGVMSLMADQPFWYDLPPTGECRTGPEGFLQTADGDWLMGFGRQNGKFACVNISDGSLRWEFDLQASCAEICTLDVDGDGLQEFVAGTSHNKLYALGDNDDQPRIVWECDLPAGTGYPGHAYPAGTGAPIAADINGDGKSEILIYGNDGYLYILGAKP